jgi:hypothetical protein
MTHIFQIITNVFGVTKDGGSCVCKQKVSGEAEGSLGCERPSPCPLPYGHDVPQGEGEVDTAKSLPNWGEGKG